MRVQLSEILKEINEDLDLIGTKYKDDRIVFNVIKYALNEGFKFNLDEGPVKRPTGLYRAGYSPISLAVELLDNKLDLFTRNDIDRRKLESMFHDLITQLDDNDAEILIAIKDQNLYNLYPKFKKSLILPYFTKE